MGFEARGTEVTTPNGKKYILRRWYAISNEWLATEIRDMGITNGMRIQVIGLTTEGQWVNHNFLKDTDIRQYWMNDLKRGEQGDCRTKAEEMSKILIGENNE